MESGTRELAPETAARVGRRTEVCVVVVVRLLAFACASTLPACQRDYGFDTFARYEATRGRYQLTVHAAGVVRAGDDLSKRSNADVTISPTTSAGSAIHFSAALPDRLLTATEIANRLKDSGYATFPEEVAETEHAIGGALAGPKGTLMEGQTKTLRVLEVTFQR